MLRSTDLVALEDRSQIVLAFAAKQEAGSLTPCGNCRDILRDAFGESFEFVCGSPGGGVAVDAKMSDMLFSDYQQVISWGRVLPVQFSKEFCAVESFFNSLPEIVQEARLIECDTYSTPNPFVPRAVHPERKYFACIVTDMNTYFGAHYVRCEYHPVYAGEIAGIRVELARDYSPIRAVYFVRETNLNVPPDVMYRDRQHLMELTFGRQVLLGKELNPPVYLGTVSGGTTTNVWRTTVKEWLPDRFSPHNFGDEFNEHLRNYYEKRARLL